MYLFHSRKHARKSRGANLRLLPPISNSSAPLSLGYDDETESGDSEEGGVELMEDPDTLRDEGVEVRRSSHTITKVCTLKILKLRLVALAVSLAAWHV